MRVPSSLQKAVPTAQQSDADTHVTPGRSLDCGAAKALGEVAIAQLPFRCPLNGPVCLSTNSESPGKLSEEPLIPLGGLAAKLSIARRTPTEQRAKASRTRGLKMPDLEAGFFRMMIFFG